MPSYKRPSLRQLLLYMLERARIFVRRAGTVILGLSIVLWAAMTYPKDGSQAEEKAISERIEQLGGDEANDEALTAQKERLQEIKAGQLAHSLAGRAGHALEPVIQPLGFDWKIGIGVIASFAAREVFVGTMNIVYALEEVEDDTTLLREHMQNERWPDGSPVFTPLVCVSIMVFFVFAMQCLSTVAVVKR
jgi:ferrous iron transport protein B